VLQIYLYQDTELFVEALLYSPHTHIYIYIMLLCCCAKTRTDRKTTTIRKHTTMSPSSLLRAHVVYNRVVAYRQAANNYCRLLTSLPPAARPSPHSCSRRFVAQSERSASRASCSTAQCSNGNALNTIAKLKTRFQATRVHGPRRREHGSSESPLTLRKPALWHIIILIIIMSGTQG